MKRKSGPVLLPLGARVSLRLHAYVPKHRRSTDPRGPTSPFRVPLPQPWGFYEASLKPPMWCGEGNMYSCPAYCLRGRNGLVDKFCFGPRAIFGPQTSQSSRGLGRPISHSGYSCSPLRSIFSMIFHPRCCSKFFCFELLARSVRNENLSDEGGCLRGVSV